MISARVYSKNETYGEEFDHLALMVNLNEKKFLVDVGFGKFSFKPLEMVPNVTLNDEFGIFMFNNFPGEYTRINVLENNQLMPQYIFKKTERAFMEFEKMCEYHQTSKESPFTKKMVVSLATPEGRITLNDTQLKITKGITETKIEFEKSNFHSKLKQYFNIQLNGLC